MSENIIDHATLTKLVSAGVVSDARVVGQHGGWTISVKYGTAERMLAAQRSKQVRQFKRMETLISYLKDVGICNFAVNAVNYAPETMARPDRAQALRQTHEAAAHDRWFRAEVEKALHEANDPSAQWISQDVIKQEMAAQRAALLALVK